MSSSIAPSTQILEPSNTNSKKRILRLMPAALVVLVSCQQPAPVMNDNDFIEIFTTPHYSTVRRITGLVELSFERSVIALCRPDQDKCQLSYAPNGEPLYCWLSFKPNRPIAEMHDTEERKIKFIDATGRATASFGLFGHQNQYPCQVEVQDVRSITNWAE